MGSHAARYPTYAHLHFRRTRSYHGSNSSFMAATIKCALKISKNLKEIFVSITDHKFFHMNLRVVSELVSTEAILLVRHQIGYFHNPSILPQCREIAFS